MLTRSEQNRRNTSPGHFLRLFIAITAASTLLTSQTQAEEKSIPRTTLSVRQAANFEVADSVKNAYGCSKVSLCNNRLVVATGLRRQATVFEFDDVHWRCTGQLRGGQWGDGFASSAAIGKQIAVVGAPGYHGGSAYVFERWPDGVWRYAARLRLPGGEQQKDGFGFAVAVTGKTVVVGAHAADVHGEDSGGLFVFEADRAGHWHLVQELVPHDAAPGKGLGYTLAASGGIIAADAHRDYRKKPHGAVYVFARKRDNTWRQEAKLIAEDAIEDEAFGMQVAADLGHVAVLSYRRGAERRNHPWVRVFERLPNGGWQRMADPPLPTNLRADVKMALSNGILVLGAQHAIPPTGQRGSLLVFEQNANKWHLAVKKSRHQNFGCAVSARENTIAVGSYDRRAGAYIFSLSGSPASSTSSTMPNSGMVSCPSSFPQPPPKIRFCGQWFGLEVGRVTCKDPEVHDLGWLWRIKSVKVVDLRGTAVSAKEARDFERAHVGTEVLR